MSFNYWTFRNTTPYQNPRRRIVDVSRRNYEAQRKAEK